MRLHVFNVEDVIWLVLIQGTKPSNLRISIRFLRLLRQIALDALFATQYVQLRTQLAWFQGSQSIPSTEEQHQAKISLKTSQSQFQVQSKLITDSYISILILSLIQKSYYQIWKTRNRKHFTLHLLYSVAKNCHSTLI